MQEPIDKPTIHLGDANNASLTPSAMQRIDIATVEAGWTDQPLMVNRILQPTKLS